MTARTLYRASAWDFKSDVGDSRDSDSVAPQGSGGAV